MVEILKAIIKAIFENPTSATSLIIGVLILVVAILGEIPKFKDHLSPGKRIGLASLGGILVCIAFAAGWSTLTPLKTYSQLSTRYSITKINGTPGAPQTPCETGFQVELEGSVTDPAADGYVVVKPLKDRLWYIQPPGPVVHTGENNTEWRGTAYLGHENGRGIGDSFAVFVVATTAKYHGDEILNAEPQGTKSETFVCKRVR